MTKKHQITDFGNEVFDVQHCTEADSGHQNLTITKVQLRDKDGIAKSEKGRIHQEKNSLGARRDKLKNSGKQQRTQCISTTKKCCNMIF